jgi:2,4-dienoyl-CoA reductase-like NADH-dependent reductase (Old Yellow Enzyme family)
MITEPRQAEAILAEGHADIVAIARELLANGNWPIAAAAELGCADPFALYPDSYAYRLRRRERERAHPVNAPGAKLPTGVDTFVPLD